MNRFTPIWLALVLIVAPYRGNAQTEQADLLVRAGRYAEALAYYAKALEADPKSEPAHFGAAATLGMMGKSDDSLIAATEGLKVAPKSVRLHLLRFDLLEKMGRTLEARADIEDASVLDGNDVDVLKRYARTMDVFGNHAGAAYSALAAALFRVKAPDSEITQALERGLLVALRDGESTVVESIEVDLKRMGVKPTGSRLAPEDAADGRAVVPGGIHALALAASMRSDISPGLFALQYSQAIANSAEGSAAFKELVYGLHLYFQMLDSLNRYGTLTADGLNVVLDLSDPANAANAQEVMRLMGWRVILTQDPVVRGVFHLAIGLGTEKDDGRRQVFSSGFGIDFFAVKQALENVHVVKLRIPYETIPIALSEKFWLEQVIGGKQPPAELFRGLADHVSAARLYVALASVSGETRQLLLAQRSTVPRLSGLASVSGETRQQLLPNLGADRLAKQYSDLLVLYGASLSAHNGEIDVPAGKAGIPAWQQLTGVSPDNPGAFINVLLQKDGGKLLAYFHTLLQLPLASQRFFTRTPERLAAFYNLFPFSAQQVFQEHNLIRRDTHFFDLARELPLDAQGHVVFPGSEGVWRAAGAPSGSRPGISGPDVEDQTLVGLLGRKYQIGPIEHYESENFLEIVHLQNVWRRPLDAQSVALLDRNYAKYRALYPYLFSLPPLDAEDLATFFRAADGIDQLSRVNRAKLDSVLGEFHGILSLLAILHETGGIADKDAKVVVLSFCLDFSLIAANDPQVRQLREYTQITLSALMKISSAVGSQAPVADDRLVEAMVGAGHDTEFKADQQQWTVNRAAWQRQRIRAVLGAQTVTSIQTLLDLYREALGLLSSQPDSASRIQGMALKSSELREITLASGDHLSPQERDGLIQARPGDVAQTIAKLLELMKPTEIPINKAEAAQGNLDALPSLAGQFLEQLTPYVKTTLVAWSYAYYASPDDMVVSGDRYFVRRHRFIAGIGDRIWQETGVQSCGDTAGVCVTGGLAELGVAAGNWGRTKTEASASLHSDGSFDEALQAELTSIRTVPWSRITTVSQHWIGLQIRAGKETIVRGAMAADDAARDSLSERLMGLVGNFRRAAIMQALSDGNSAAALDLLSAADLYFLEESMRRESRDWRLPGPLFDALDAAASSVTPDAIGYFGGSHFHTEGTVNPQVIELGPCEEYERLLRKDALWECSGHLLLSIAEAADREGIPADATAILSEAALRQLGKSVVMVDQNDWMSVVRAMNRISLLEALPELERARKD